MHSLFISPLSIRDGSEGSLAREARLIITTLAASTQNHIFMKAETPSPFFLNEPEWLHFTVYTPFFYDLASPFS